MKHYPHPILAKEGWPFILFTVVVSIIAYLLGGWYLSLPFILVAIFVIQFFRDPKREISQLPNLILSPADGRVIAIDTVVDPYQGVEASKISIFMNVFNVHSNRSPVDGKILDAQYVKGKFVNADFDKASLENERNALVVELESGKKITIVQVAGLIARRILCYVKVGEALKRGQRYGFIRFGSRVDVYLPKEAVILVTLNQKVKATETVLAKLEG